jgi:hypothetical protein
MSTNRPTALAWGFAFGSAILRTSMPSTIALTVADLDSEIGPLVGADLGRCRAAAVPRAKHCLHSACTLYTAESFLTDELAGEMLEIFPLKAH